MTSIHLEGYYNWGKYIDTTLEDDVTFLFGCSLSKSNTHIIINYGLSNYYSIYSVIEKLTGVLTFTFTL